MSKLKAALKEIRITIIAAFHLDHLKHLKRKAVDSELFSEAEQAAVADAAISEKLSEKLPEIKGRSLHVATRLVSILTALVIFVLCALMFNAFTTNYVHRQAEEAISETTSYHKALDKVTLKMANKSLTASETNSLKKERNIITEDFKDLNLPVTVKIINLESEDYLNNYATEDEIILVDFYNVSKSKDEYDFTGVEEISINDRHYYVSSSSFIIASDDTNVAGGTGAGNDLYSLRYDDISLKNSEVLLYVDETANTNMITSINHALLVILLIAGLVGTIVGLISGGRINRSVNRLKILMGRIVETDREKVALEPTGFEEFDELTGMVNEMSEQVAQAQIIQKQVFQNASHELRTPLMSIQGYAEGIQAGVFKDYQDAAGVIISESRKMSELVDEILFISRIDEGTVQMRVDNLNIRQLLEDCREDVSMAAHRNGVMIVEEIEDSDYDSRGDEKQLSKAIGNIISNAVRYAKTKVTITMKPLDKQFVITVSDDGQGITEEDLPHIFERFYKGAGGNFGIGLSITKDVLEKHNGTVKAENAEEGTRFTVTLPKEDSL